LLQLHEIADVSLLGKLCTGPQSGKGPDDGQLSDLGALEVAVGEDLSAVGDLAVEDHTSLPDADPAPDARFAAKRHERFQDAVGTHLDALVHISDGRVHYRDAVLHQLRIAPL